MPSTSTLEIGAGFLRGIVLSLSIWILLTCIVYVAGGAESLLARHVSIYGLVVSVIAIIVSIIGLICTRRFPAWVMAIVDGLMALNFLANAIGMTVALVDFRYNWLLLLSVWLTFIASFFMMGWDVALHKDRAHDGHAHAAPAVEEV